MGFGTPQIGDEVKHKEHGWFDTVTDLVPPDMIETENHGKWNADDVEVRSRP